MRRFQKRKILDLVFLLYEAHDIIKKYVKRKDYDYAYTLLQECQQNALDIGNIIENLQGEDAEPIEYLEKYCEQLYRVSEEILTLDSYKQYKLLNESLYKAESSIREISCGKIEVLFLPYKASMWDSLESIWFAAKDDDRCECYVMPIPYFDKNPDGTFRKMHYEGNLFPDYVPVTDWKSYRLEEHYPDIIYIHNPYDDCNLVTSVHPDFYSKRLKEYTDMLVYCPYFVNLGQVPDHFCTTKGVLYADRVVVTAEKIKDTYVKNYEQWTGKKPETFMNKFLVEGSPKIDRVIRSGRERKQDALPEICKGKKVVLFNTSINDFLKTNERFLVKLNRVFDMAARYPDIALWWRPHPLLEATIQSMRSSLYPEYLDLKQKFINQGIGVYDDTAQLNRAIAWSDAYCGSRGSSLVSLYGVTGKPIFIMDESIIPKQHPFEEGESAVNEMIQTQKLFSSVYRFIERTEQDMCFFFEQLIAGKISYSESQSIAFKDNFSALHDVDGTECGKRIHEKIIGSIEDET